MNNERSCLYENGPGSSRDALLEKLPLRTIEGEWQRSLDMIELSQRRLNHLIQDKQTPVSDQLEACLRDMQAASSRLDRTLNNTTALLRCIQGGEQPQWETLDLCAFVRVLCSVSQSLKERMHIRLTLDCGSQSPLYIQADRRFLSQICLHLLSNALRACAPEGGTVALVLHPDGHGGATLTLTDTGCGLPDNNNYASMDANRVHFLGGTRTGLLLCQEYCRLSGWQLELSRRPRGRGTVATLAMPRPALDQVRPVLHSPSPEEDLYKAQALWLQLVVELRNIPGLEDAPFAIPTKIP